MLRFKQKKFELSPRLKLGVGRSHTQNRVLKIATISCLVLALLLAGNAVRIILRHNSASPSPTSPQVLGASDTKTSQTEPQFITYQVKKGDTLFNISQQFHIDWETVATLNNLKSPFSLKPGQTLNLPK